MTAVPKLAGVAEVAGLAGVSRQRAAQITRLPSFPAPVQELAMGPVWIESEVTKFLATPRKPGRPSKALSRSLPGKPAVNLAAVVQPLLAATDAASLRPGRVSAPGAQSRDGNASAGSDLL
jgi:hypothetical protein